MIWINALLPLWNDRNRYEGMSVYVWETLENLKASLVMLLYLDSFKKLFPFTPFKFSLYSFVDVAWSHTYPST